MKRSSILLALKGFCVGATMLIPGVSGGSMAMILGVYDELISSVSSFLQHKKASLIFLSIFCAGGLLGVLLFATPVQHLLTRFPLPTLYFFMGAVAGSVPMICRKAKMSRKSWYLSIWAAAGVLCVLLLSGTPVVSGGAAKASPLVLLGLGAVAAVALVLPGISVSYVLLLFGLYNPVIDGIRNFNLPLLLPLGAGLVLGILLVTRLLERAMQRYPQPTYLLILGFLVGSLGEIFPGLPHGWGWIICGVCCAAGFAGVQFLSRFED